MFLRRYLRKKYSIAKEIVTGLYPIIAGVILLYHLYLYVMSGVFKLLEEQGFYFLFSQPAGQILLLLSHGISRTAEDSHFGFNNPYI